MNLEILFLYNSWLWYSMLAHKFGPDLDDGISDLLATVQLHDTKLLNGMNAGITENENLITWEHDVNNVLAIADELTIAQVAVFNSMEGHSFRNNVASKLDALVSLEMAASQNIRNRMVTAVKSEVKTLFATNKTAKENAMNQAIAILTAGPSAKMGKDVVGEAFGVAVKNYQESYSKLPAGTDDIILNLEKEMAAIVTPIKFEVTGGNVFETNLIRL
jgi:Mitochondrial ATP synthase B chain precursor (ATP-synt_B)